MNIMKQRAETVLHWMQVKQVPFNALCEATDIEHHLLAAIVERRYTSSPDQREAICSALGVEVDDISWLHEKAEVNHLYGH